MSLVVDIEKRLGSFRLKVQLEAGDETIALLGASGCGKSMTLKCIAGVETPDRGRIIVDNRVLFDSGRGINLPPQRRRTGMMFQNYALFPNMTVLKNIRAGARREPDPRKRERDVAAAMEAFGLQELGNRLPGQLSGGQQQRVALARILVSRPDILLLDEPFSALDSHLRFCLEQEVCQVIRRFQKTVVLVSHDRDEVFRMSDRVALMEEGGITAIGGSRDVFAAPQTRSGAALTGCRFLSEARRIAPDRVFASDWGLEMQIPQGDQTIAAVGVRAQDVRPGPGQNGILCRVVEEIENPFDYTLLLRPVGAGEGLPLGWTVGREYWQRARASVVEIHIPESAILLLRA